MEIKNLELEIFAQSVSHDFTPILEKMSFQKEQINSRLFTFSKENLTIKIYFPECHGYDINITLSPIHTKKAYDKSERQLYWFGEFLNIGNFATSRRNSPDQIPELVKINTEFLQRTLSVLDLSKNNFWQELDKFIDQKVN